MAERLPGELCKKSLQENCLISPDTTSTYVRLDSSNPVLGDLRIRQAMSLAVDRKTIGDMLMGGALPAKMIIGPSATGYNANLPELEYNMGKAKALVAEAIADGVPVADTPLTLATMTGGFIGNTDVMQVLLEQYKKIGITNIKAEVRERGPAWRGMFVGVPQPIDPKQGMIAMHKHTNDPYDFSGTVNAFYTCNGRLSTSCNPKIDQLQEKAKILTGEARQKAYEEIAELAYNDLYYIPLHHETRFHGLSSKFNWQPPLHAGIRLTDISRK